MQHLVHKVLHGVLSWPDGLSMRVGGGEGVGAGKEGRTEETHGLESAFFGFRDALSGSDIADYEKGKNRPQQGMEYEGKRHSLFLAIIAP